MTIRFRTKVNRVAGGYDGGTPDVTLEPSSDASMWFPPFSTAWNLAPFPLGRITVRFVELPL